MEIFKRPGIAARRLPLDDGYALQVGPIADRFLVTGRADKTQSYLASVFALDFDKLGVFCGDPIPEPERFFAIWRLLFDAVFAAATPIVALSENESNQAIGAPFFALTKTELERLDARRAEFPLLLSMAAVVVFLCFVLLGFANTARLRG